MNLLITSGRGPKECRIAVGDTSDVMVKEAEALGLYANCVFGPQDREGDCASIVVTLEGDGVEAFAKSWIGTIQWIAKSTVREGHKRKNWFLSVSVVPDPPSVDPIIREEDVRFETFRAGGPGGQHQNVTDSAVRATHVPSNRSVVVRDGRSQHQNKKIAVERLADLLRLQAEMKKGAIQELAWRAHDQLERGNPVRVFKG